MRWALAAVLLVASAAGFACGPKQLPKGPPPEYEDPPAPSFLKDGGSPLATPPVQIPAQPPPSTEPGS